jgi:Stress responsive A/B Barrel Domain
MTIEHLVLYKFKAETSAAKISFILEQQKALQTQVTGIIEASIGQNFSDRAGGYTHCGRLCFFDRASLDAFYPHAAHQAFKALLQPEIESLLVIDYEAS